MTANLAEARSLLGSDPQRTARAVPRGARRRTGQRRGADVHGLAARLSAGGASEETAALAIEQAMADLEAVIADNPGYADAHCLYAVMAARILPEPDLDLARAQGEACLA